MSREATDKIARILSEADEAVYDVVRLLERELASMRAVVDEIFDILCEADADADHVIEYHVKDLPTYYRNACGALARAKDLLTRTPPEKQREPDEAMTDEQVLAEVAAEGIDARAEAERIRGLMLSAYDKTMAEKRALQERPLKRDSKSVVNPEPVEPSAPRAEAERDEALRKLWELEEQAQHESARIVRERDAYKRDFEAELAGNLLLRKQYGAKDDESIASRFTAHPDDVHELAEAIDAFAEQARDEENEVCADDCFHEAAACMDRAARADSKAVADGCGQERSDHLTEHAIRQRREAVGAERCDKRIRARGSSRRG
jgi:hypothetical protein